MNYAYEIKKLEIIEYSQQGYPECSWYLNDFSKNSLRFLLISDLHKTYFFRTKKWLQINHPELLL